MIAAEITAGRSHRPREGIAPASGAVEPAGPSSRSCRSDEFWVNPDRPTLVTPFEAITRTRASVPAMAFGHLTHTLSANTLWDVRVGRFVYSQESPPSTGDRTTPSRFDRETGVTSGAPPQFGALTIMRTTTKATISHYRPGLLGADHQWKMGGQVERGEHHSPTVIPTGVRFVDSGGQPFQAISRAPSHEGGLFITAAGFASDAITVGNRLTINAGVRFDHSRAISQDLRALDPQGPETNAIVRGLGTLYTWNLGSPRLGVTTKLTADGRTILRASYGRFSQGVLTGEISPFHPGVTPITTAAFDPATGAYTRPVSVVDPRINLQLNPQTHAPRTDEYSVGVDREVGRRLALSPSICSSSAASRGRRPRRSCCRRATSAFCLSRAARAGCRRNRCSICACRGPFPSAAWAASSCCWTCSTRSMTRRRRGWRRTICSARISVSPRCSWTRVAPWSA